MVLRFAAVVVQQDRFAEQAAHENGRQRCEEKRGVRRREHVDEVGAPQLAIEQRPVAQLCDDGPDISHTQQPIERGARHGIDGNDPRLDVRVVRPAGQHALRLHCLAAENPERGDDDGNAKTTGGRMTHTAGFTWLQSRCKRDDLSGFEWLNRMSASSPQPYSRSSI